MQHGQQSPAAAAEGEGDPPGDAAAVDKGTQSRAPDADGPQAGNKLEKERKIIISQRQQAMHDLDTNLPPSPAPEDE